MPGLSTLAAVVALAVGALGTIEITSPSKTAYWIQFQSNTISWDYTPGDPSPVSIQIVNQNASALNGAFFIDEAVDVSTRAYTISNVTLKVADGYAVQFVPAGNSSTVYAESDLFSVRPNGTAPAPTASPSASVSATAGAASANASSTVSGQPSASQSAKSGASGVFVSWALVAGSTILGGLVLLL